MGKKFLLVWAAILLAIPSLSAVALHVETGYAETLSNANCYFANASFKGAWWEAGYQGRASFHDLSFRTDWHVTRHFTVNPTMHLQVSDKDVLLLDGTIAFGMDFLGRKGNWNLSFILGVQGSAYLSRESKTQLFSMAFDYHCKFGWRFFQNRWGWQVAVDSSQLYWYEYYLLGSIFTLSTDYRLNEDLEVGLYGRVRFTDMLKENRYLSLVQIGATCTWRLGQ